MEDNDGMSEEEVASLEFLREKSVVSFGDSVDRECVYLSFSHSVERADEDGQCAVKRSISAPSLGAGSI